MNRPSSGQSFIRTLEIGEPPTCENNFILFSNKSKPQSLQAILYFSRIKIQAILYMLDKNYEFFYKLCFCTFKTFLSYNRDQQKWLFLP